MNELNEKIITVKTNYFPPVMFHFNHSLRPFILTEDGLGNQLFIDLDNFRAMTWDEVEWEMLFYDNPDNPDEENFCGVAVIGEFRV